MAKTLGAKSILIRRAIAANPGVGNTDLATMLNDSAERLDDKIKVSAQDVAMQRQALKQGGTVPPAAGTPAAPAPAAAEAPSPAAPARKKPGRKPGSKNAPKPAAPVSATPPRAAAQTDIVAHVEAIREAVQRLGGEQVKRLVDLFK